MYHDLRHLGLIDEDEIMLDEAALLLALLDHADVDIGLYDDVLEAIALRLATVGSSPTSAGRRAAVLVQVLADEFGFAGDAETYDDPANADLIRVIDRRRGLPVSLAILYVAAARRLGWSADILDLPGHVLVLVGDAEASVIIDPFRGGAAVDRNQLAALVVAMDREVSPTMRHVAAMTNRAVLVRLLLNQATRAGRRAGDGVRWSSIPE